MTIYGVGYRGLQYEPTSWFGRIWPIASMEFHKLFRSKRGLGLFIAAYWYVLIKIGALYVFLGVSMDAEGRTVRRTFEAMQRMSSDANTLFNPFVPAFYFDHALEHGFLAFLILTSLVSVRAIAGDRATNALEIYWTRSISTLGYFLGKWLGSFLLLAAVFAGGPLFCWIFSLLIAPDWDYVGHTIAYVPGVLAVLLLQCLVLPQPRHVPVGWHPACQRGGRQAPGGTGAGLLGGLGRGARLRRDLDLGCSQQDLLRPGG
ncbi:MAG: ABC transporter permease [Planctomycetota bacterium]|jgi:ABC-type transport system involved in multi-copper enzyme maturation permease subunit